MLFQGLANEDNKANFVGENQELFWKNHLFTLTKIKNTLSDKTVWKSTLLSFSVFWGFCWEWWYSLSAWLYRTKGDWKIFQLLHQTRITLKTYHSVSLSTSFTFLSSSGCFQSQCKLYYVLTKLYSVQKHQWPLTWWWADRLNIWYLSFPHQAS